MGYLAIKTEHSGAKHGRGAYYGRKIEAKKDSNKRRRNHNKLEIKVGVMEEDVKKDKWRPEPTQVDLDLVAEITLLVSNKALYSSIDYTNLLLDIITKIREDSQEKGYSEGYEAAEYDAAFNESWYGSMG